MTHTKYFEKVETNRDRRFAMNNSPRMKFLTLCIGAALAQIASLPALADSAVGVDTVIGNAANPGYAAGPVQLDSDVPFVKRTPTGQMYNFPPVKEEGVAEGQAVGAVEVGYTHDDSEQVRNAKRNEYTDMPKNGVVVNNFNLSADSAAARYFSINGGGVGRNDQFFDVTVGKYGSWKVKGFYNETQHVFTDTWKSFYSGEGTGTLVTGLNSPTMVTSGAYTAGALNYVGATSTCTATAPCWSYNGKVYGNAVAVAAINGVSGTANATTGAIATVSGTGASGAVQSNMAAAISAKLAATPYSELSLIRKKGGLRGDVNLTDNLKGYASYTLENRVGARPLAMNDNNLSTEIAEPIDYDTHDMLLGLSYNDGLNQANLRASASLFRNSISTMNVQYALLGGATNFGAIQHATFDLAPDSEAYNVTGDFARSLPDLWNGRFTASASFGSNRQNDPLLAPVSAAQSADLAAAGVTFYNGANAGFAANSGLVSNWNTTSALSQQNAGQQIDNKLVDLGLSLKPLDDLRVGGNYRFYETDNKGGYTAYNPLTGQFGRGPAGGQAVTTLEVLVAPSGTGTGCYTLPGFPVVAGCSAATLANGGNVPVFSQARSTRQLNYGITADYDLTSTKSLNAAIEREDFHRTFREREKTGENKVKLGYVDRALGDATLRISYENDTKRGSDYRYRTFEDLGTGLPGLDIATQIAIESTGFVNAAGVVTATPTAVTINGITYPVLNANLFTRYSTMFRKYDQADRNQDILNTRVNLMARDDLDVGLNLQLKRADYPNSFYGLTRDNQDSIGLDMNYQPSSDRTITAFYNYQKGNKGMKLNSGVGGTACTVVGQVFSAVTCADTSGGSTGARPDASAWASDTSDTNNVFGMGLQQELGFAKLGVDYTYARSSTHIAYNFGSAAFNATAATNAAMALLAGSALPDMTTVQNTITLNLVKPLDKKTSVRAFYRYDAMTIADWHYDGVIHNAMAAYDGGTMLLDSGPQSYHVNTVGVFLNYKL